MKHFWILPAVCMVLLCLCGCGGEVGLRKASAAERRDYCSMQISGDVLSGDTLNLLGNYSLNDLLDDDPERLISELSRLFSREPAAKFLVALADVSLAAANRIGDADRDLAARFYLNAAIYSVAYLGSPKIKPSPYDPAVVRLIQIYNMAVSELFCYLRDRDLLGKSGFELRCVIGGTVRFEPADYRLSVPREQVRKMLLCADYRTENLTHSGRSFGVGAPLIIDIDKPVTDGLAGFARNQTIPGTFVIEFKCRRFGVGGEYSARISFVDSGKHDHVRWGGHDIPLERDLSTPLAYMVKDPPLLNFIDYTRLPGASKPMQGLYRFSPADDERIPVVLVHGLLSDARTWLQMINTLQSDPDINRNYQFLGFSYSSGNPVFFSAWQLRTALTHERERMVAEKRDTAKFDRMVMIGHSMGGLLTRLSVSDSGDILIDSSVGKGKYEELKKQLSPDERRMVDDVSHFKPLPFVRRVVFIAVPHRGSRLAQTRLARWGSSLIQLPPGITRINRMMVEAMFGKRMAERTLYITGVDNLNPDNAALKMLNLLPMSKKIKYHSVIGDVKKAGAPGGSDGVVPYSSSHLDGVESEMIVNSGHSAQKEPLAIQEIRRILLEHLGQYPDSVLSSPLSFDREKMESGL